VRLIRLTLLVGDPEGLRSAVIAGRTTVLFGCPWGNLKELPARHEATLPAVYFLVGTLWPEGPDTLDVPQEAIYIGETDALATRFVAHHRSDEADWRQIYARHNNRRLFQQGAWITRRTPTLREGQVRWARKAAHPET
jgi:hypothetical protein